MGMAFGHHDLQVLPHQIPFCEDFSKKVFIQTIYEAWTN
jgi:hypothetical protein